MRNSPAGSGALVEKRSSCGCPLKQQLAETLYGPDSAWALATIPVTFSTANCGCPCRATSIRPPLTPAHLVEHDVFGERKRDRVLSHIALIAGAVGVEIETQGRSDDGDLARLDPAGQKRTDIEPDISKDLASRNGRSSRPSRSATLMSSNLSSGGQKKEVNLAADFHVATEQGLAASVSNTAQLFQSMKSGAAKSALKTRIAQRQSQKEEFTAV